MAEIPNNKTGIAIRKNRVKQGLSQQKLAEMLNVEPQTVSKWETGKGMPDIKYILRLAEVFGCSTDDLLRPAEEVIGEENAEAPTEEPEPEQTGSMLPVLYEALENEQPDGEGEKAASGGKKKRKVSAFDFLSKKKMKETVGRVFGVEYENTFTKKFLFSDLKRKRNKQEYEETLTQGMFRNDPSHTVLGLTAPWLYLRVFAFLFLCTLFALLSSVLTDEPTSFLFFCGLSAVVPMIVFLYEVNFSRDVSLFSLAKYFAIGGIASVFAALFLSFSTGYEVLDSVLIAPVVEEFCKALITVIVLCRIKPKTALTGMLIGFTVGAGFDMLENFIYAINTYITLFAENIVTILYDEASYEELWDVLGESISVMRLRTFTSYFVGHHYFTGIFAGLFVMFKDKTPYRFPDLFRPKALAALGVSMVLHALWNTGSVLDIPVLPFVISVVAIVLCLGVFIALLNIAIAQIRVMDIYETKKNRDSDADAFAEQTNEAAADAEVPV